MASQTATHGVASPDFAFCEQRVRADDKDRFFAALFAPAAGRGALFALYAFDLEIRAIALRVREPMAGEIRLQWWCDVVEGTRDAEARASPVAAALSAIIEQAGLRALVLTTIEAHALDFAQSPFADRQGLERYAQETAGTIFQAAALVLDPSVDRTALKRVAAHAGTAVAIVDLLRQFARNAARGQNWIPVDMLASQGMTGEAALNSPASPGLLRALADLRDIARDRHAAAAAELRSLSPAARPAFLELALLPLYLRRLQQADRDPFLPPAEVPQWRRQLRLWRAARTLR